MIRIQPARHPRRASGPRSKVGLAVAGGGPLGGIYELGVLLALDEALENVDLVDLDAYVGVSSGAFIAASLANHLSPRQMARIFINSDAPEYPLKPDLFLRPAFREYWRRAQRIPSVLWRSLLELARNPLDLSLGSPLGPLAALVPAGVFDNAKIARFLQRVYTRAGRSNDFRKLDRHLFIVAVDLDTGAAVRFGSPGYDQVPISRAVQASAALPGLYPPVEIGGRYYVDGALRRTLHASAALKAGADLLIGLNPLVPYDGTRADFTPRDSLVRGGLPMVLSQTFRAMIQSRMQVGIQKYGSEYPRADLVIVEPDRDDTKMFFTNVFSYSSRHELCEHAYQSARADLRARRAELEPILARHGITFDHALLDDPHRTFLTGVEEEGRTFLAQRLTRTLDRLESAISREAVC